MSGAVSMAGVFIVVTVQLIFAEIHGSEAVHHHRSELVDGPPLAEGNPAIKLAAHLEQKAKAEEKGAFLRVALLEMGILFHSIFIGTQ
jgi:hypothetical protein